MARMVRDKRNRMPLSVGLERIAVGVQLPAGAASAGYGGEVGCPDAPLRHDILPGRVRLQVIAPRPGRGRRGVRPGRADRRLGHLGRQPGARREGGWAGSLRRRRMPSPTGNSHLPVRSISSAWSTRSVLNPCCPIASTSSPGTRGRRPSVTACHQDLRQKVLGPAEQGGLPDAGPSITSPHLPVRNVEVEAINPA